MIRLPVCTRSLAGQRAAVVVMVGMMEDAAAQLGGGNGT